MKLIIGLGNPGQKYQKTRHNFGFLAADYIKSEFGGFSEWAHDEKANALISKGEIAEEEIILVKPQTFMNLCGQAVASLAHFLNVPVTDIWIVHDDFDLPLGIMRLSKSSSAAGHKGIKSIIEALGTKDFTRFRLGIHPIGQSFLSVLFKKIASLEKFVLKNFSKDEFKTAEQMLRKLTDAIQAAIKDGPEKAMNEFN